MDWDERREGAVEGVGDGAEEFGFGFQDEAVGGNGLSAGVEDVLFDLRGGQGKAVQGGVNPGEIGLVGREERDFGLGGVAQGLSALLEGGFDFLGVVIGQPGEDGKQD